MKYCQSNPGEPAPRAPSRGGVAAVMLAGAVCAPLALAGGPQSYPDGHGGEVTFPLGDASFADAVVHYSSGDPQPRPGAANPQLALGVPDIAEHDNGGYTTLGCGGELVLTFDDNALIDVPGPDLYVFEIGPDVEPTAMAVSNDGEQWTRIGRITGGKAEIDLAPYVSGDTDFSYVRLVDLKTSCGGKTPGADIDAVGGIGSAQRIALDSAVLFDSGEYQLKPAASQAIDDVLTRIENRGATSVVVAGHTDGVGSAEDNQTLSRNRAAAVADYLVEHGGFSANRVTREAFGETRPIASNETPAGRAKNRRVELTVKTPRKANGEGAPRVEILGIWDARGHGILEMRRVDGEFEGDYSSDGGRLLGEFTSDTVFEGYWVEDNSRRSCDSEKAGSDHWGPLRIVFESPARDAFKAKWRYCGEDEWRGEWKRAQRML
ncbi:MULTISPECIES: OmpA family protein [unclassified Guyparkeria]|uniref:OmpA family protein n=1 Tax=unclassified Guyparkeria TaxID=2626246 RepID=UPI0009EC3471|nr:MULTISPECIES: OmpA family protein [unclassified Guyparkeria]